ncbi:MAG: 2,3-bisphosphoglycerate-independent phosphoglycerate mutase, partial [Desulfocucumaceae bacterium]
MPYKPVMLVILDGWGISDSKEGNAIAWAKKPCYDWLLKHYPHTTLQTSGEHVGLPEGQMGNSEVGHLNMGAGRVVYQELTRINKAIRTSELQHNQVLTEAAAVALQKDKAVHLMGLLSDGGVHSHIKHLFALLEMLKNRGQQKIFIHIFLDGRDVSPSSAKEYILQLEEKLQDIGVGRIATVSGRYFPMDRDNRWDRVEKGYRAMVEGQGQQAFSAVEAVEKAYAAGQTDEFVEPTVIVGKDLQPLGMVQSEDVLLFFNFRADRAREISHAFTDKNFTGFIRAGGWLNLHYVCLTQYDITLQCPVAFPPQNLNNTLGEIVSAAGLKQLRIAETEKYAHVTFFFNGGVEKPYPGEDRVLIASPKVATYDLQPEMSAVEITDNVLEIIKDNKYDLIVLNYANPDMVGHTGELSAAVLAIEAVDKCIRRLVEPIGEKGGAVIITADHGNAEYMTDDATQQCVTAHTSNPVPLILVNKDSANFQLREGSLQDIAPTVLE